MNTLPGGLSLIVHVVIILFGWIYDRMKALRAKVQRAVFHRRQYGMLLPYDLMNQRIDILRFTPSKRGIFRALALVTVVSLVVVISTLGWQLLGGAYQEPTNIPFASALAQKAVAFAEVSSVQ